jgi:hypothetical protein
MTYWLGSGEPAREATCEVRHAIENHDSPLRATGQLGLAVDSSPRFTANAGVGLDLVRVDRACMEGNGVLPDKPHLRSTIGLWLDGTVLYHASPIVRPALHFAFGRHDVGWLKIPEWEGFAIVGLAHRFSSDDTRVLSWTPSFSIGVRLISLQAELRLDPGDPSAREGRGGTTFMTFIGLHYDGGSW